MSFSERLKILRNSKGITQQDLADILKVERPTIAGYETKGKQPDYDKLLILSDYFNVSIDYLLGKSDIKEPAEKIIEKNKDTEYTLALHNAKGYDDNLPEEAKKEIDNFIEYIKNKYKDK
ncbi:helix-turn-helix domain-containing protein [Clostridium sp. 'White wine YQ']|uniref:helix-turn-helix domain-containing protein n=1 Tax=Clostridium sp. 'White wine YQ' TaxID=3027474 RepID=UPI0023660211|nr:helix-turn-helix transcriptional regulator [Clostridium sp. 'White wine YQ']MDD7793662.1 helix-turn-helix transcriptional regulator [Clostridium sp. 'White wine YQ']